MRILVVDVAAEHSGALTILNQFREEFENDKENEYFVLVSKLNFQNTDNIKYFSYPWIKKSRLYRLFFDNIYIKYIIKKMRPDKLLSLQNNAVSSKIEQDVYFHNALFICEKRYSFFESKSLWIYQNIISRFIKHSLKHANKIIVQANWIKNELNLKWNISENRIEVKRPNLDCNYWNNANNRICMNTTKKLFYPANNNLYKNHFNLLKALFTVWDNEANSNLPELILTSKLNELPQNLQEIIVEKNYPISFVGHLDFNQMKDIYSKTDMIFPSYIETVGLPLMEASLMGAYILAADCEYAHETIGEYNKVIYFDPHDIDSIVDAINQYIQMD